MSKTDIYLYDRNIAKNADYTVWLAFPGVKSFALSSLGYLWMFKDIDQLEDVNIEMLCTDSKTTRYRGENVDLIGFSFTFDMDFLSIFSTLERFSLPLKSSERGSDCPLVFAGGPVVSANPVPYKDFFDFIIIGDGEDINLKVVELCKNNKGKPKQKILEKLSELEGIYVPSIKQDRVKKLTKCLESCVFTPIISSDAFFSNTFIIEMSRGCANRCGFCLASYMNLPLRSAPYESVLNAIDLGLKYTDKIALLGAQISAHPKFAEIFKYIDNKIKSGQKISIYFQKGENLVEISCLITKAYEDRIVVELPQYFMRYIEFLNVGQRLTVKVFSKIGTVDFNTIIISSPLEDDFMIEYDRNAIKLTPTSEIPSVEAIESLNIKLPDSNILREKTFVLSTEYIKSYSDYSFKVNDTFEGELILPKNYGIINFTGTVTEVDPVYDNEFTASYSNMIEEDRQALLYYMYLYSNNSD